jgi:hypothetical protein
VDYFFTLSLGIGVPKLKIATKSTQVEAPDHLSALLFFQNSSDKYEEQMSWHRMDAIRSAKTHS